MTARSILGSVCCFHSQYGLPNIYLVITKTMEILRKSPKHILAMDNVKEAIVISAHNDYVEYDMLNNTTTAHYLISYNGDITPYATDDSVLNHCPHTYMNWDNMNYVSLWIIVEKRAWRFSDKQRKSLTKLTKQLTKRYNIPKNKIFVIDEIDDSKTYTTALMKWWEDYKTDLHFSSSYVWENDTINKIQWTQNEINIREQLKSMRILNFDDEWIDPRIYTLLDRTIKYMKWMPLYE